MKYSHFTLTLIFIACLFNTSAQNPYSGNQAQTSLSKALNRKQVIHLTEQWFLNDFKGNNRLELYVEAIHYHASGKKDLLKGLKLSILDPNGLVGEAGSKTGNAYHAYIDQEEFTDILRALNQMIDDVKKRDMSGINGSMTYISKGGVFLGFLMNKQKQVAQLGIAFENAPVLLEFSNVEKTLIEFRDQVNIASKELYLIANKEKENKPKRGKKNTEDVIVDDI